MNRQSVLIWILVVVVMFGLPLHYMDAAIEGNRAKLKEGQAKLAPLRKEVEALRQREQQLTDRKRVLEAISTRLIEGQPFATIQRELTAVAVKSGVSLSSLILEGPESVADLSAVVKYKATLQVTGNRNQYLEFLRQLERHSLLIELPEVSLRTQPPAAKGAVPPASQVPQATQKPQAPQVPQAPQEPQVQQLLVLGFYAKK
ncbi:MAG TPA: hypothetical protein VD969_05995 [Symbiobacteriaceae bacterium]|nr:hypothetical protein [Symbiobacteriaceae bacterium]